MANLREVAAHAGVDVSTASKVLTGAQIRVSETTRLRIQAAARDLDYTPNPYARGLRLQRKGALGMAVRNTTNYTFPEIVEGAEEAAERLGTSLFLVKQPDAENADRLLSIIRQGRMDGWIFADDAPREGFFEELATLGVPFITLNRYGKGCGRHVCLDDEAGFRLQADRILAAGHRRVAFVAVQPESFISRLCRETFMKQMARAFLPITPSRVLKSTFEGDCASEVVDALLKMRPTPTVVACGSSQTAMRIIDALVVRGIRVPDDISVVGYHDPPAAAAFRPALSTVRMPSRAQGRLAAERLVEMIEGSRTDFAGEVVGEPVEFVERESLAHLP